MKKILFGFLALFAVLLTGCSSMENYLGEKMLESSSIETREDYLHYIDYSESGKLNNDGRYMATASDTLDASENDVVHGPIHVTFAENNSLNVSILYHDANGCIVESGYFNPGDAIYATIATDSEVSGKSFEFSGFNIYEYTSEGKRVLRNNSLAGDFSANGLVLQIPADFSGTELAVEPVGLYHPMVLALNDYYFDNGKEMPLSGAWTINGQIFDGNTAEVNQTTNHIISYEYDKNEYFYITSEPSAQYVNNDYGLVVFDQSVTPEVSEFSVGLHKYIDVSVISDTERTLEVNGGGEQRVKANERVLTPKMKYGDKITIETNKKWDNLENNSDLVQTSYEELDNGKYKFRYVLVLPEPNSNFEFDPSKYETREHGTLIFRYLGEEVTDKIYPAVGRKIYYEEKRAEAGFWLPEGDHYIEVKDAADTERQLESIQFIPKVKVSVKLLQPDYGGTITYKINGKQIESQDLKNDLYSTYSGAIIGMDFDIWAGWMPKSGVNLYNGLTYEVTGSEDQTLKIDGRNVKDIIQEDPEHKPTLKVTLDKSVGENMRFNLSASGLNYTEQSYSGSWYQNKRVIINKQIGTEEGVRITMSGRSISTGEAVKIVITKKGENHLDHKKITPIVETRLVENLADIQTPIEIYAKNVISSSTIWYDSIEIELSVVSVDQYQAFTPLPNSSIQVFDQARSKVLLPGDQIESNQKVTVTILPDAGYYITGKGVTTDSYKSDMSYSDYLKKGAEIIQNHPPHKYCRITLDASDSFATYFYTLDSVGKSGTINAKVGQELRLSYEIMEGSDHQIAVPGGIQGIGASKTKAVKTIKITDDMDGKTITRQDFGIEVT